jgi:hypothetical protein
MQVSPLDPDAALDPLYLTAPTTDPRRCALLEPEQFCNPISYLGSNRRSVLMITGEG